MDLRSILDAWTAMGEETAANSRAQRAQRYEQEVPFPAQLAADMVHPITHFGDPNEDPIQNAIGLGTFGISPFRGAIATARPLMTEAEKLWQRAQQGDIHAKGQLTGEMFQRDLKEFQGPPAPEDPFPGNRPRAYHGGPGGGFPREDFKYMNIDDFTPPYMGEIHGDRAWNGTRWVHKSELPRGFNQPIPPQEGWGIKSEPPPISRQPPTSTEGLDPNILAPGDKVGNKVWDGQQWMDMSPIPPAGPEGYVGRYPTEEELNQGLFPVDDHGMAYDPEDLNLPWQKYDEAVNNLTPEEQQRLNDRLDATVPPDWNFPDEPISNLDPTMGGAFPEGMSYEDWQNVLARMQARPLPPGINPFGPRGGFREGYPDGY